LKFNSRIASRVTRGAISAFTQDAHSQDMHPIHGRNTLSVELKAQCRRGFYVYVILNLRSRYFPRCKTSCKI